MQVQALARDALLQTVYDRAKQLHATDSGSAAARAVVLREASRIEQIPGDDSSALLARVEELKASSRASGRRALGWAVGLAGVGVATGMAIGGPAAFYVPLGALGAASIAGMISWGGYSNGRFYQETGEMIERWARVAQAPPLAPGPLPRVDSSTPASKQQLLDLMEASRGYLAAHLDQPGHPAALAEVEQDLTDLSRRPETDLAELRAHLRAENVELRKKMHRVGWGAMGGMVLGLATLPLVGVAGMVVGFGSSAGLATVGQFMLRHEGRQLRLGRNLQGWETQLERLKEMSGEVERLAAPGSSAGIKEQAGFLLIGGVRVPIAPRTA